MLTERCRAAARGEGSVVIVAGEAGAGKTRLVSEFCRTLPPHGARCAVGRCLEYIQLPYAPFLAVLGAFVANDPAVLSSAPHIKAGLAHLIPELQSSAASPPRQPLDKLRQFNMMAEALQRFGSARPAVAVIEDLHWADSGTREVLLHLLSYIATSHVLLILTYRSDELLRDHPLRSTLAKLERDRVVRSTNLEPLDSAEMHSLLIHALDERDVIPPRVINAICTKAEGNPLFAEELLKTVLGTESGRELPSTVQEAVRDRLRRLSAAERSTLVHAAAIGRRFKADFLAEVLGQSVERITPALRQALDLELIAEERDGAVYYSFRHELQQQAIYSELLVAEAQSLHRRIALALEATKADEHTMELAYHWWQAHEPAKAALYNERAGDAAFAIFAYSDALTNYERAVGAGVTQGLRLAELSLKLSKALHQCGFGERAKEAALSALAQYEAAGDKENAAQVCLNLAQLSFDLGDVPSVRHFAERALAFISADPNNPIFFNAQVEMAALNIYVWDAAKARYHIDQAERFTGVAAPAAKIRFLQSKTAIDACSGNLQQALEQTRAAAGLASESRDFRSALRSWDNFATGMAQIGERELALHGFREALSVIRQHNIGGLSANWCLIDFAHACLHHGELDKARDLVEQVLAAGMDMPKLRMWIARTGILVGLRLELDDLIERCAEPSLIDYALQSNDAPSIGATASFAEYYAAQSRPDEVRALLHRALEALATIKLRLGPGEVDKFLVSLACLGIQGDIPQARTLLEHIASTSRVRSTPACLALLDAYGHARAAARAGGDRAATNAKALEAARLFHEIGWPHYEAQALELAGQEEDALWAYRWFGDLRDTHRLEAKLTPVNRRGRSKHGLTIREREIFNLLATGKSNKSIAETLVISERTVENQVSSILTKFEVGSRAELIAKFKDGSVDPDL